MIIEHFDYRGYFGCACFCRLEIMPLCDANERVLVVATEIEDNPGTSITNAAEDLARQVCEFAGIFPLYRLVWVEHYGYAPPGKCWPEPRGFDRVKFTLTRDGRKPFADPTWSPMRDEDWRALGLEPREPVTYELVPARKVTASHLPECRKLLDTLKRERAKGGVR